MNDQPHQPIRLTMQTALDLQDQVNGLLNAETNNPEKHSALMALKNALENMVPFLPASIQSTPDELTLDAEIREEIVIAGANENG